MLAKTSVYHYKLGTDCRRYTLCALLALIDLGDSDIIRSMLEQTDKK
ncbi:unnamed protein product [Gulo gulo]|uniref:Uncharacterized protein n=1 Tax=Gulo gulo TaxID=48420 RepID=A0A9X9M2R9_GULGU|nr:unnamed protein product [Gulo gulo]